MLGWRLGHGVGTIEGCTDGICVGLNVGLLVGDRGTKIGRVMTCLTITPDVVAEAIEVVEDAQERLHRTEGAVGLAVGG